MDSDYVRFPRQFRIEDPRFPVGDGTKNLIIQVNTTQVLSVDLTDEEINRLYDCLDDYAQYG